RYSGCPVAPSYWNRTGITWRATKVRPSRMASLHAIRLSLDELARLLAGYGCSHELLGGDEERSPVRAVRNHRLRGMQPVVGRLDAGGCSSGLHHGDRLEEEPSRLDDGAVCGTEVLAASIDDGAHAFLHRAVLHVDAVDTGEGLRPLHATIQQVVVLAVALGAECRLVHVHGAIAESRFQAVLIGQRRRDAVVPVVDHGGAVHHRPPDVASAARHPAPSRAGARGTDLMEGHDEVVRPHVDVPAVERA